MKLPPLSPYLAWAQRPAQRVDHAVERPRDAPQLLHAQAPHLGIGRGQAERLGKRRGQVALGALRQHGRPGVDLGARLVGAERLAVAAEALVAGDHAADGAVADEQRLRVGLGQHHHAELLGLLGQVAAELREREDPVALVVEGRRRGDADAVAGPHEIDRLVPDRPVARQLLDRRVRQQVAQRRGVHDRTGQQVRAGHPALVEHRDGHLAQPLGGGRVVGQELAEADGPGEAGRPAADEEHADVDALVLGRLRLGHELARSRAVDTLTGAAPRPRMLPVCRFVTMPARPGTDV